MNRRGQALIEFVLILPLLLFIVLGFIDFGKIILSKTHLENVLSEIVLLDEKDIDNYLEKENDDIRYQIKYDKYKKIILETKVDLITPGIKNILKNPYVIQVERSIVYE